MLKAFRREMFQIVENICKKLCVLYVNDCMNVMIVSLTTWRLRFKPELQMSYPKRHIPVHVRVR